MKVAEIRIIKKDETELVNVSLLFSGFYGLLSKNLLERLKFQQK